MKLLTGIVVLVWSVYCTAMFLLLEAALSRQHTELSDYRPVVPRRVTDKAPLPLPLPTITTTTTTTSTKFMPKQRQLGQRITHPTWTLEGRPLSRFPQYGTADFAHECGWTITTQRPPTLPLQLQHNCTISGRPRPGNSEGIGMWISDVVTAALVAQQSGCRLVFDYGDGVDMDSVIRPISSSLRLNQAHDKKEELRSATRFELSSNGGPLYNWTVPTHDAFNCTKEQHCFGPPFQQVEESVSAFLGTKIAKVPGYRFAYHDSDRFWIYKNDFRDLERALVNFTVPTGMACVLGALFHLSPRASRYQPNLFTDILPRLQDRDAFVMALYIRTGMADHMADVEMQKGQTSNDRRAYALDQQLERAKRAVQGALQLEKLFLKENRNSTPSRIVWMVLSDSTEAKRWIMDGYHGKSVIENQYPQQEQASSHSPFGDIQRTVLSTAARGTHTRTFRKPSSTDFAEAFLDWYLLGESHVVVSYGGVSFGATGALRTARPFYKGTVRQEPVHVYKKI